METTVNSCSELLERFDRLERANRRLRITAIFLGVALVLLGVVGVGCLRPIPAVGAKPAAVAKVLQVQRLELVNKQGKVIATLGVASNGDAELTLWSKNGLKNLTLDPRTFEGRPRLAYAPYTEHSPWIILLQQSQPRR